MPLHIRFLFRLIFTVNGALPDVLYDENLSKFPEIFGNEYVHTPCSKSSKVELSL